MSTSERVKQIVGWVLHVPVAGLMLFAGANKVFASPELVEQMQKFGLGDNARLIGSGEVVSALLLLVPRTSSLGLLLTSAFWGGAICTHMAHGESYLLQSGLLLLTWVGAYLRNPATLSSFFPAAAKSQPVPVHSEALAS
jgi:hypothetical protein